MLYSEGRRTPHRLKSRRRRPYCLTLPLPYQRIVICTVGLGFVDDCGGYFAAEGEAYFVVGAEVDAGLETRLGGVFGAFTEVLLVGGKEIRIQLGKHAAHHSMTGGITGEGW